VARFDATQKKVLGAVLTTMLRHHDRVRERQWIAEQYVSAVAPALEDAADMQAGVARVRDHARAQRQTILNAAYRVFAQAARDLSTRRSFSYEDAVEQALGYFA